MNGVWARVATRPGAPALVRIFSLSLLVAAHSYWIHVNLEPFTVDFDEAYLLLRVNEFREAGFGLWIPWTSPHQSAPALAAVTGSTANMFGGSPLALRLPILLALVIFCTAYYMQASFLAGRLIADISTVLLATAPVTIWFSRAHHQILPAAAMLLACHAVVIRSRVLADRWTGYALGLLLGIAAVTRAMLLPFLLVAVFAIIATVLTGPSSLRRVRSLNLLKALVIASAVGSTWWIRSGTLAISWLRLGSEFGDQGPDFLSWGHWKRELLRTPRVVAGIEAYSVRWVVVAALLLCVAVAAVLSSRRTPTSPSSLSDEVRFLTSVGVAGALVLFVVRDDFTGFYLLTVPPMMLLGSMLVRPYPPVATLSAVLAIALSVQSVALMLGPTYSWHAVVVAAESPHSRTGRAPSGWDPSYRDIVQVAQRAGHSSRGVVLANDGLIAANILQYVSDESNVDIEWSHAFRTSSPRDAADVSDFLNSLEPGTVVIYSSPSIAQVGGVFDSTEVVAMLRANGLREVQEDGELSLPNGRRVHLWVA